MATHKFHKNTFEETSFEIKDDLIITLNNNDPPFASLLSLRKEGSALIETSITFENSEILKKAMLQPDCTIEYLLSVFNTLHLFNFKSEVEHTINVDGQPTP